MGRHHAFAFDLASGAVRNPLTPNNNDPNSRDGTGNEQMRTGAGTSDSRPKGGRRGRQNSLVWDEASDAEGDGDGDGDGGRDGGRHGYGYSVRDGASFKNDERAKGQMAGSAFRLDDEDEDDEPSSRSRQAGDLV
jgi:hypothetical protein